MGGMMSEGTRIWVLNITVRSFWLHGLQVEALANCAFI